MRLILLLIGLICFVVGQKSWARPMYFADAVHPVVSKSIATAAPKSEMHEAVTVRVRTVQAQQTIPTSQISRRHVASVSDDLRDISKKLARLPFQSFKLLSSQSLQIPFNKQAEMQLVDGHKLTFKPLQERDQRVCLWMEWNHGGKMEVLNTRLHFNYGESMLTGMESADDTGIILAVDVQPVIIAPR